VKTREAVVEKRKTTAPNLNFKRRNRGATKKMPHNSDNITLTVLPHFCRVKTVAVPRRSSITLRGGNRFASSRTNP
jgi:hypothetical protein